MSSRGYEYQRLPVNNYYFIILFVMFVFIRMTLIGSDKFLNQESLIFTLVLVQPRKTCPIITERLLMGRKESNKKKNIIDFYIVNSLTTYVD